MEKWVDDFARCEELVEELLEKVSLVTDYGSEKIENETPLVQGEVEKLENCEVLGSLMGGAEKRKNVKRKMKMCSGETISKENGGGGDLQSKRKSWKMHN